MTITINIKIDKIIIDAITISPAILLFVEWVTQINYNSISDFVTLVTYDSAAKNR